MDEDMFSEAEMQILDLAHETANQGIPTVDLL